MDFFALLVGSICQSVIKTALLICAEWFSDRGLTSVFGSKRKMAGIDAMQFKRSKSETTSCVSVKATFLDFLQVLSSFVLYRFKLLWSQHQLSFYLHLIVLDSLSFERHNCWRPGKDIEQSPLG